jgi:hypothetical protein
MTEQNRSHQNQLDGIRTALLVDKVPVEQIIANLTNSGIDDETAKSMVLTVIKDYKNELFQAKKEEAKADQSFEVAFMVVFVTALIGPIFDIVSAEWYLCTLLIAGVAGYFGMRNKPVAGVLSAITYVIAFPFAYTQYFANRTSFIKIEMVIPMLMAAVPALVIGLLISFVFYRNSED